MVKKPEGRALRTRDPLMLNVAGRFVYLKPGRDPRFLHIQHFLLRGSACMPCPDVEKKQGAQRASFYVYAFQFCFVQGPASNVKSRHII